MEEVPPCHAINNEPSPAVAKGKRTKRLRPQSPNPNLFTPEEEETARCLIMLAQGAYFSSSNNNNNNSNHSESGYTCKTCNRVFSSFQALGGHRTSHKKPKIEKRSPLFYDDDFSLNNYKRAHSLSPQLPRIHECSYCGAEFTSGQALGGHMRRHRATPLPPRPNPAVVPTNGLSLDLNFPAPQDHDNHPSFQFGSGQPVTPTLVDCHF